MAAAARMFAQRPSALLGILSEDVALDIDVAAWAVLQSHENEAHRRAAENAKRASQGLPPLPPPYGEGAGRDLTRRQPREVRIVVNGQTRVVPAPPPGAVYDKTGNLIDLGARKR